MATFKITGGPDLKARLDSVAAGPYTDVWATDTANRMRATKPASKEAASNVFTTKVTQLRGAVCGAFWWIFVDRGTKAHDIRIRNKRALSDHTTIFGTKSHHARIARRPFITKAAQDALAGSALADLIVRQWNRRRFTSHKGFL